MVHFLYFHALSFELKLFLTRSFPLIYHHMLFCVPTNFNAFT